MAPLAPAPAAGPQPAPLARAAARHCPGPTADGTVAGLVGTGARGGLEQSGGGPTQVGRTHACKRQVQQLRPYQLSAMSGRLAVATRAG